MREQNEQSPPDGKIKEAFRMAVISERDYNARYHDHKEKMAWLATTVYLGALIALYNVGIESNFRIGLFFIVLLTAILLFFFLRRLFSDRETSANIVAACTTLLTRINASDFILTECMRCPVELNQLGYEYPRVLVEEINDRSKHNHSWYFWPHIIVLYLWTSAFLLGIFYK